MKILLDILILLVGFVALIKGADWFVDGSAAVARRFRVPGVIIGLTIVAMGTSAPELAVSTAAAIGGSNEIAISNVAGSNLFNLLMVLGVCAIIHAVPVDEPIVKRDYPVNLGITLLLLLFVGLPGLLAGTLVPDLDFSAAMREQVGEVSRWYGILALLIFAGYVFFLIRAAKKNKSYKKIAVVKGGSKISYKNKKLKKGKYFYKVRPYRTANGKAVFASYSHYKKVKIK